MVQSDSFIGKFSGTTEHLNTNASDEIVQHLQLSGFENLSNLEETPIINHNIVSALVSTYDPADQTFVFGKNKKISVYFGLSDILCILGLPIDGLPLLTKHTNSDVVENNLFPDQEIIHKKSKGMPVRVLRERVENQLLSLDIRIRSYCLYLIGSFLLPNSSNGYVNPIYGAFVNRIDKLQAFAWGEAVMVEIHHQLKMLKLNEKKTIGGCMWALMAFAFLRISKLRAMFEVSDLEMKFPLIRHWPKKLKRIGKNSKNFINTNFIIQLLDELEIEDIIEDPYSEIMNNMPEYYKSCMKRVEKPRILFNLNRGIFNKSYLCLNQDRSDDLKEEIKRLKAIYKSVNTASFIECKGLRGGHTKDLWKVWMKKLKINDKKCFLNLRDTEHEALVEYLSDPYPKLDKRNEDDDNELNNRKREDELLNDESTLHCTTRMICYDRKRKNPRVVSYERKRKQSGTWLRWQNDE